MSYFSWVSAIGPPFPCGRHGDGIVWHKYCPELGGPATPAFACRRASFGAVTSGQALLNDYPGRLVFWGGLTAGRGHAGDSPGRRAVLACVADATPDSRDLPVFGCPLLDSE